MRADGSYSPTDMAETTRQEGIYTLRIENGPALQNFEQLNKALQNVRANRTQLNKAVRENIKAEKELERVIANQGAATEDQTKELNRLRTQREALNREQSKAIIIERDLASRVRESSNDLSGLTERGERFRDKMSKAFLEALNGSSIFQQLGNRTEFLKTELEDTNTALEAQRKRIEEARRAFDEGTLAEQEYAQAIEDATREITQQEEKQNRLQTELTQTETKSEELKVQVQALTTAFQKGEITVEQFRSGMKNLEQTAQNAKGAFNVDDWFNQFSTSQADELKSNLKSLALQYVGIGAAVEGARRIIGSAIDTVVEFDAALAKIRALGDDYRAQIDSIAEAARTAGTRFGFTATESAAAVEALAKAGVTVSAILGGGLTGALTLAASGNLSVGDAAEIAANAMTQFGLAGEDVTHIADLLSAGANQATGDVSDFAQALKQSGLVAAQFNIPIEETIGTLTSFASAGLLGSDAGTSFRTMLLRLAKPSQEAADTMERLGIATFDANGQFVGIEELAGQLNERLGDLTEEQRNAALATIFGSDAIRAASILYEQGAQGIADWTKKVNQTGFAAKVAEEQQNTLQGSLNRAKAAWEGFVLSIDSGSGTIARSLRGILTVFADILEGFALIERRSAALRDLRGEFDEFAKATGRTLDESLIEQEINRIRIQQIADARQQQDEFQIELFEGRRRRLEAEVRDLERQQGALLPAQLVGLFARKVELQGLTAEIESRKASLQEQATIQAKATEADDAATASIGGQARAVQDRNAAQRDNIALKKEMDAAAAEPVTPLQPISPEQQLQDANPLPPQEATQPDRERLDILLDLYEQERIAWQELQDAKTASIGAFANALAGLTEQGSDAAKVFLAIEKAAAIANVVVQTQRAIAAATAAAAAVPPIIPPGIPNPAFVAAQSIAAAQIARAKVTAGVSIATILAQAIRGFASGGEISGDVTPAWGPRIKRSNGDNVLVGAGRGMVTLRTGEKVLNERQQRRLEMLTGGNIWRMIGLPGYATGGTVTRRQLTRGTALVNMPTAPNNFGTGFETRAAVDAERSAEIQLLAERPIVASWAEGMKVGDRINLRESL